MKYMLLIYFDEQALAPEQEKQIMADCSQFTDQLKTKGQFLASDRLHPTSTATSVRSKEGKRVVIDGPFAETREQLGGYCLIEAKDLDEAIEIASRVPPGRLGTIEVRPVMEINY
ncbi:MAG TPA: YciI family protein [bacterium]|nr:YciI family protein [bacterium]